MPYIDVRLSFNSFIPADLDEALAGRLVDYYIRKLQAQPTLHDKVEFEIVFSCYTPDLPQRLQALTVEGFSQAELGQIADSLRQRAASQASGYGVRSIACGNTMNSLGWTAPFAIWCRNWRWIRLLAIKSFS